MVRLASLVATLVAALVVVGSAPAAPPASTSIEIQQHASLFPNGVLVSVVLQCPAGTEAILIVQVQQGAVSGAFDDIHTCTGSKDQVNVPVPGLGGVFTPGSANAGVGVRDLEVFSQATDQRVITIS